MRGRYGIIYGIIGIILLMLTVTIDESFKKIYFYDSIRSIEVAYVQESNGQGIPPTEWNNIKRRLIDYNVTGFSIDKGLLNNKKRNIFEKASVYYVDDDYFRMFRFDFVSGSGFDPNSVDRRAKHIIISDVLSERLFGSLQTAGREIDMNSETYAVYGVYRSGQSVLNAAIKNDFTKVFVPYLCGVVDNKRTSIGDIVITGKDEKELPGYTDELQSKLAEYSHAYVFTSNIDRAKGIFQSTQVFIFVIGIILITRLIKILSLLFKARLSQYKKMFSENYFSGILYKHPFIILRDTIAVFVFVSAIVGIFRYIRFDFYISPSALPDNIFDIGFYLNRFMENSSTRDVSFILNRSFIDNELLHFITLKKVIATAFFFFTITSEIFITAYLKSPDISDLRKSATAAVLVVSGIIGGACVSVLMTGQMYLDWKVMLLVLGYLFSGTILNLKRGIKDISLLKHR